MLDNFESKITFEIPTNLDFESMALSNNYTLLLTGIEEMDFNNLAHNRADFGINTEGDYDRFIGDVWVGVVLTLMIVTSIFCMCACFLYHKFRQWKQSGEYWCCWIEKDLLVDSSNGCVSIYWNISPGLFSLPVNCFRTQQRECCLLNAC